MIKKILLLPLLMGIFLLACSKSEQGSENNNGHNSNIEPGIAKGRVLDGRGNPIAGARVYVDNTVYFNSGISTTSDANGYYRVQVPAGSWRVYARISVTYNGKTFDKIDLHPDNANSFSGPDGTICNFKWKLTGEKPLPLGGYYGGSVNLYNDPNSDLYDVENIEFTFTPAAPLIDGSSGEVIKAKSGLPLTPLFKKIEDLPIGRYTVTARHLPSGKTIKLAHNDNQFQYASSITIDFEPELNFCSRCVTILYNEK
jgi:hypothetical protein